jgi:hypothetical protein
LIIDTVDLLQVSERRIDSGIVIKRRILSIYLPCSHYYRNRNYGAGNKTGEFKSALQHGYLVFGPHIGIVQPTPATYPFAPK